jgi:L-Ala-D/L-Glu epimerase
MRITKADIFKVRLPLISPFVISLGSFTHVESIILKLATDSGLVGWGESTPAAFVTGETWESTYALLKHDLLKYVVRADPLKRQEILYTVNRAVRSVPAARAAVDIALFDLAGKHCGVSVATLLGGAVRDRLCWHQTLSIADPDKMAAQARDAVAAGHDEIKMKVGSARLADDVARVLAVRKAAGEDLRLQIDVNQGWRDPATAITAIRALAAARPDWIEQAIAADDLEGLAEIRQATGVAQMVDEGVLGAQDLLRAIKLRCADLVNIKLMKTGGITEATAMVAMAETAGMRSMIGSMLECTIGTAAGVQVALAGRTVVSNGLIGPTLLRSDIAFGLTYERGTLRLDQKIPGLGVSVNEDELKRFTQEAATIEAQPE